MPHLSAGVLWLGSQVPSVLQLPTKSSCLLPWALKVALRTLWASRFQTCHPTVDPGTQLSSILGPNSL